MREIKAYIRKDKIEDVMDAIIAAGVSGFTLTDVSGLGAAAEENKTWSIEYSKKYSSVAKLEFVCHDKDEDYLVETIRAKAWTGHKGDGMIFTAPIYVAVRIRTGEKGDVALKSSDETAAEE